MASKITIDLTEWRGPEIRELMYEAAKSAVDSAADAVIDRIIELAPTGPGHRKDARDMGGYLKDRANWEKSTGGLKGGGAQALVSNVSQRGPEGHPSETISAYEAQFTEFGTTDKRPQPFARPAMDMTAPEFEAIAAEKLKEIIDT